MWQLSCILLFIVFIAWFGLYIVIITCSTHRNVKINLFGIIIFNVIVFNVGLYINWESLLISQKSNIGSCMVSKLTVYGSLNITLW